MENVDYEHVDAKGKSYEEVTGIAKAERPDKRIQGLCQKCSSYCDNWGKEVRETMDVQAPGEECSNGMQTWKDKPCPCFDDTTVL